MDPSGKVAVITGGASGIGLATAKLLAANGARVVIGDLQAELGSAAAAEIETAGGQAHFVRTDVLIRDDQQRLLDTTVKRFGRVDIVHNNAGINERGDFLAPGADEWEETLATDLQAVIRATQIAVVQLRKQGGGVIINTASMGGIIPIPTSPIYATSKAGVIQLSRSLGHLASEGIRVNAICPSYTDTPMVRAAGEQVMEMMAQEVGGILKAEDIAQGVLKLVQDDSRAGAVMRVTVRNGHDYAFERRERR